MARLNWGMIGGGEGSQIGPAHRLGAGLDGAFSFVAGALDHRPEAGRDYGARLGLDPDRAYGDWREMLDGERDRPDRVDLVTVATPNATHFEITKAFLEAGFHVLCEKPMTMTVRGGRGDRPAGPRDRADLRGQLRLYRLFAGPAHAGDGGARRSRRDPAGEGGIRPRASRGRRRRGQSARALAL